MKQFLSDFTNQLRANAEVDWLLELDYDDSGTTKTLRFASKDRYIEGSLYHGLVTDWGDITTKVNLAESKASYPDVTVTLVDKWPNETGRLSAYLFDRSGSRVFIGQQVRLHLWTAGIRTLSDAPVIFTGTLSNITYDDGRVSLVFEVLDYTDGRYLERTVYSRFLPGGSAKVPIVYGDFTYASSTWAIPTQCAVTEVWPYPVYKVNTHYLSLAHEDAGDTTYNNTRRSHVWHECSQQFVPLLQFYLPNNTHYDGVMAMDTSGDLTQVWYRPDTVNLYQSYRATNFDVGDCSTGVVDTDKLCDTDTDNYAWCQLVASHTLTVVESEFEVKNCQPMGTASSVYARINRRIEVTTSGTGTVTFDIKLYFWDEQNTTWVQKEHFTNLNTFPQDWAEVDGAEYTAQDENIKWKIRLELTSSGSDHRVNMTFKTNHWEALIRSYYPLPFTDDHEEVLKWVGHNFYTGMDGLLASYTAGDGAPAEHPDEIFRDILYRFLDIDYADADIDGASEWISARQNSTWRMKWWSTGRDRITIKEALQQLQYEGAFIWLWENDGARVFFVDDAYSDTDVDATLTDDQVRKVRIGLSDLQDMKKKWEYKYNMHPATGELQDVVDYTATNASTWGITNEEEKDLYWVYGDTTAQAVADYYGRLLDEPKIVVDAEVIDPQYWALEVGDIVKFNLSSLSPFGESWSDLYFMVIETRLEMGKMKIKVREVYRNNGGSPS